MVEPASTMVSAPDDDQLIERCRAGDADAFRRLVELHAPDIGRFVSALTEEPELVADTVQDTFVLAWRAIGRYRTGDCRAWLKRIALNQVRQQRRSAWWRRVELVGQTPQPRRAIEGPEVVVLRRERTERIRAAIGHLPLAQAEAVRLRFLLGESYPAMAQLLGVPEATLRSRVKAGIDRLRLDLGDYFDEVDR